MSLSIDTIIQAHTFNGISFQIKRVKNLDELVDQIDDSLFNEDERLPYWGELWPAAIGLSNYLAKNPALLTDKDVIELGCGLGLTSLLISNQRPKSLLVTDYEQDALGLTEDNFVLNKLPLPQTHLLDWRQPDLAQKFDVIVASDVLYEERFFEPLLNTFNKLLNIKGFILLAEPGRPIAGKFFEFLKQQNYNIQRFSESVEQDEKEIQVGIYQIHK